jgi:hypothetical protein
MLEGHAGAIDKGEMGVLVSTIEVCSCNTVQYVES